MILDSCYQLPYSYLLRTNITKWINSPMQHMINSMKFTASLKSQNIKRLLNQSWSQSLSAQLESEAVSFGGCAATDDFAEGIRAFVEKRLPRFGGN